MTMETYEIRQYKETFERRLEDIKSLLDIDTLEASIKEIEAETYENGFWDDHKRAQRVIKRLKEKKNRLEAYQELERGLENIEVALELIEMEESAEGVEDDIAHLERAFDKLETLLFLSEEYDSAPAILEIHPGAGGTESHDWALMLYRMYKRYAERKGFSFIVNDYLEGGEAGLKNATVTIRGEHAYGLLKNEHGVHRLVRISPFDSSSRRHTSFAAVTVIPEVDDEIDIELKDADLRIDTYRSSGAGGQHVNTTDSAVRITHLPTDVTVTCQNERSQIKNREQALKILKAKLFRLEKEKKQEEIMQIKGEGSAVAFGSQIRSYVLHPYNMVKDHRTEVETAQVQKVLDGEIDEFILGHLKQLSKERERDAKDA